MKILFVIETCSGGSGRHLLDLAHGSAAAGHSVHITFSPRRADSAFLAGLSRLRGVRRFPVDMSTAPSRDDLRALRQLKRYIERMGPFDIIHGHSSKGGALARLAAGRGESRRVYTPHALYTMNPSLSAAKRRFYAAIEKLLAKFVTDNIIMVSKEEHLHALEYGIPQQKMKVIVNGVKSQTSREIGEKRLRTRQRLKLTEDVPVLGFVGRLDEQKAPERFIELAAKLVPDFPKAQFIMLGAGEKEAQIQELIVANDLSRHVRLFSSESGEEFMPAFDLFVLTSRYEAMPYVLIEALAAGLPIVSTDVGGAQTVIEEAVNGHIVPESDDLSLMVEKISALLNKPERLAGFSQAARQKAVQFQEDEMVAQTLDFYTSTSKSQRPAEIAENTCP